MISPSKLPWPHAVNVVAIDAFRLRVQMNDGRHILLDLGPLVRRRDAYWRLRQSRNFRQAGVDPLGGIC